MAKRSAKIPDSDPRIEEVRSLNRIYNAGKLRLLVGAGASIASGFPGWDALNLGLLDEQMTRLAQADKDWAKLLSPQLGKVAADLYAALEREGAAEFAEASTGWIEPGHTENENRRNFRRLLAKVLYAPVAPDEPALRAIHAQVASLSDKARIVTTNYDSLLERAIARKLAAEGRSVDWQSLRQPAGAEQAEAKNLPAVEHIHGWLDPDGTSSRELVLTEANYYRLTAEPNSWTNQVLKAILGKEGAVVITGMSLNDPNLRRLLYKVQEEGREDARIYVILATRGPLLDRYVEKHWSHRGVRVLYVGQHDEVPGLLRDIQWGLPAPGAPPNWVAKVVRHIDNALGADILFDDNWQLLAYESLRTIRRRLRMLFGVALTEQVHISLFVPLETGGQPARLCLVAHSRSLRSGEYRRSHVNDRALDIGWQQEQGIAGQAFVSGTEREGSELVDQGFTDRMKRDWVASTGFRDWRTILAWPYLSTPWSLPTAVITVTSNLTEPFWQRFGPNHDRFQAEMRAVFTSTLDILLDRNRLLSIHEN